MNDGVLPQYYISNNHEPIIDRRTFEAVQMELNEGLKFISQVTPQFHIRSRVK